MQFSLCQAYAKWYHWNKLPAELGSLGESVYVWKYSNNKISFEQTTV